MQQRLAWLEVQLELAETKGWPTEEAEDLLANAQHTLGIYDHLLAVTKELDDDDEPWGGPAA